MRIITLIIFITMELKIIINIRNEFWCSVKITIITNRKYIEIL